MPGIPQRNARAYHGRDKHHPGRCGHVPFTGPLMKPLRID